MASNKKIRVEVAYASPERQCIVAVEVEKDATVAEVIKRSAIASLFPEIDLNTQHIGIFSQPCALTDKVEEGNRIEIYRPLTIDPKEARRAKAKKKR
jgi:putative ubiquitin-RnfH superfamily antitoxin RatB of RatAB toxin-antitoxin module